MFCFEAIFLVILNFKACPDGVKKDGHFHLAPPNLKFVLRPRTDIELPSNYAEFDSALDCIKELFFI